jgi:3-oxoadipate enol-lactonase
MPFTRFDEAEIYFETYGEGPAVIFVHGSGGNHLSWWRQIPTLSQHFRCVIFDQRGFGLSRATTMSDDGMIDDVTRLMDHLRIERAHLVGQSLGGRTCLGFALAHPDRVNGLVLAATLAGIADPLIAQAMASVDPAPSGLMERALSQRFRAEQCDLTFLYHEIEALNHVAGDPPPVGSAVFQRGELAKLGVPTLFIVGTEDPVAPPQAVRLAATLISGARCEVVADSGHSVYLERPEAFNRLVQSFLINLL